MRRHIEHNPAGHDGRHVVRAQPGKARELRDLLRLEAVVVHAVLIADMPQAVQLRTDTQPADEDVVVVRGVGKGLAALLLAGLYHVQAHLARCEGRRRRLHRRRHRDSRDAQIRPH